MSVILGTLIAQEIRIAWGGGQGGNGTHFSTGDPVKFHKLLDSLNQRLAKRTDAGDIVVRSRKTERHRNSLGIYYPIVHQLNEIFEVRLKIRLEQFLKYSLKIDWLSANLE